MYMPFFDSIKETELGAKFFTPIASSFGIWNTVICMHFLIHSK